MIHLYYHGGSANHGCEAIVRATAKLFEEKLTLFSSAPCEDVKYAVDQVVEVVEDIYVPVNRMSFEYFICALDHKLWGHDYQFVKRGHQKLLRHVTKGDVCLSIGGDNYCYSGTDKLRYYNRMLREKGCKTVLWGCSVDSTALTKDVIEDLKKYDLITVRESMSLDSLKEVGISENVILCADPAFELEIVQRPLPNGFTTENTIGINVSPLVIGCGKMVLENYEELIRYILKETEYKVLLIPHVVKTDSDDRETLKKLYEKFPDDKIALYSDCNCMELKGIISQCRMFIGARTHATIAAYSTCVPTLVSGYSIKARGIARDIFGTDSHYVVPVQSFDDSECLKKAFVWLRDHENEIRETLRNVMPEYKKKSRVAVKAVQRMIKE